MADDERGSEPRPESGSEPGPPPPPPPGPPEAPQPGATPPPPGPPAAGQPAGAGIRFGARIIDGLLLAVPFWIVVGIAGGDIAGSGGASLLYGLLGSALSVGYFVYLESSRGQTIGKQVLNLRTVGPQEGNPTQQEAFLRNAWVLLGIIPVLGGLASLGIAIWIAISISSDPARRGVHDNWAGGTSVIRTR